MKVSPPIEPERVLRPHAKDGALEQCVVRVVMERGDVCGVVIRDVVCNVVV